MKKDQHFSAVLPPNLHQGFAMNPLRSLQHLHFTTSKNSIFVQKETLVKLPGQMLALKIINSCNHLNDKGCSNI